MHPQSWALLPGSFPNDTILGNMRAPSGSSLRSQVSSPFMRFLAAGAAVISCALGVTRESHAQATVELKLSAGVSGRAVAGRALLPQRVMMVVDGSGSMDVTEGGVRRWKLVLDAIRGDIATLATAGVPIELTVVKFGSNQSDVDARGASGSWHGMVLSVPDAAQVSEDVVSNLGTPGGGTALMLSIQNAVSAMARDLGSGRYSGGQIIVYSDGEDSAKTAVFGNYDVLKPDTIAAIRKLRGDHSLTNIVIRPFGEEAKRVSKELPDTVDLASGSLPQLPPSVASLGLSPNLLDISPIRAKSVLHVVVRSDDIREDLAQGISVTVLAGGRKHPAVLSAGLWTADIDLPRSDNGCDIVVSARTASVPDATAHIVAPALVLPTNPREWGLPECSGSWGLSCLVGQPVNLSVRVPADAAKVTWSATDGSGWSAEGASVVHGAFTAPGSHSIAVTVTTADGKKTETLTVKAIDPSVAIEGPNFIDVGRAATFRVLPTSGALLSGARSGDIRWFVDGRPAGEGATLKLSPRQRGKVSVVAELPIVACGQTVRATGSLYSAVNAVPSVELGDTVLVRGALNRIPARVLVASRVGAVKFTVAGGAEVRAVIADTSAADSASVSMSVPAELLRSGDKVTIRAMPEIKGDDGKVDTEASRSATVERVYSIRNPDPSVVIDEPTVGQEASYEVALPVKFHVEGSLADIAAVANVRVEYSDGTHQDLRVGKDLVATASCTPRFATSGQRSLAIKAFAIDADGNQIGKKVDRTVALHQPTLQLQPSSVTVHRQSLAPGELTVSIVCPEKASDWERGISQTTWIVEPSGAVVIASQSPTQIVLQISGTQEVSVTAVITRGGQEERIGPVKVPVVVDLIKPDYKVTTLNSAFQIGTVIGEQVLRIQDRTEGPVASRQFLLRREGGDWVEINPSSFKFTAAPRPGEKIEVKAFFTSIDGSVVETGVQEFTASPDHKWWLVAILVIVGLALSGLCWFLTQNNEFLGARAVWSADESGSTDGGKMTIRWLQGRAKCSIITKRAMIPLPRMFEGNFEWMETLHERRAFLEWGGSIIKPRLNREFDGAVTDGLRDNAKVRRTTIQPRSSGDPLYLSIDPSPTAAFLSWATLLASLACIWIAFVLLFFRGYI